MLEQLEVGNGGKALSRDASLAPLGVGPIEFVDGPGGAESEDRTPQADS